MLQPSEPVSSAGRLGALLRAAGSTFDAAEATDLIRGVLAAPPAADPDAWIALIAAQPGAELVAALTALKMELAAGAGEAPWSRTRIEAMRGELTRQGLAGFLIPRGDEHQGEYVPAHA